MLRLARVWRFLSWQQALGTPWQQLLAFIKTPQLEPMTGSSNPKKVHGWRKLAEYTVAFPLEVLATHQRTHDQPNLVDSLEQWRQGSGFIPPPYTQ